MDLFDEQPDESGFVDMAALREVVERAVDELRKIGLTLQSEAVTAMVGPDGNMIVNLPCLVRPSAKKKLTEDRDAREEFNRMMAQQNQAMIEQKRQQLADLLRRGVDSLFDEDEECSHERRHPEGFCLDCGEGMNDG